MATLRFLTKESLNPRSKLIESRRRSKDLDLDHTNLDLDDVNLEVDVPSFDAVFPDSSKIDVNASNVQGDHHRVGTQNRVAAYPQAVGKAACPQGSRRSVEEMVGKACSAVVLPLAAGIPWVA